MCQPPPAADTPPRAKPDAMAPAELASEPVKHSIDLSITRQARVFFQHRPSECNFRGTTYHSVHRCAPTLLRSPKLLRPSTRRDSQIEQRPEPASTHDGGGGIALPRASASCLVLSAWRARLSVRERLVVSVSMRSTCAPGLAQYIYIYRVGSNKLSHNVHRELKRVGANEKADFPYLVRRAERAEAPRAGPFRNVPNASAPNAFQERSEWG